MEQYAARCCAMQYAAMCCNTLRYAPIIYNMLRHAGNMVRSDAMCCNIISFFQRLISMRSVEAECPGHFFTCSKNIRSVAADCPGHFRTNSKVCVLSGQNARATFSHIEKYAFCRGRMPGPLFHILKSMRSVEAECPGQFSSPPRASAGRALWSFSNKSYTNGARPGLSFET